MECPRCLGFMVFDACLNLEGDPNNNVWISEWRCLNCGEVFDARTLENRASQRQAASSRFKEFRGSGLRSFQLSGKAT
jgi:hypothetical protein